MLHLLWVWFSGTDKGAVEHGEETEEEEGGREAEMEGERGREAEMEREGGREAEMKAVFQSTLQTQAEVSRGEPHV